MFIRGSPRGCLSPFLFSMYVNDLEETLVVHDFKGIEISMLKLFLLLYADGIIIFFKVSRRFTNGFRF